MSHNNSRRSFLRFIPGTLLALCAAPAVFAQGQQNPPPPNTGQGGTPKGGGGGAFPTNGSGSGGGSGGFGPSPAQQGGDIQTPHNAIPPDDPKKTKKNDPNKDLRADETELHQQVRQLAEYVSELKQEIEKTDSTKVLSVDIFRKTKDIEKLAHHIASLEKG
jgi:hypothetical protein